MSKTTLINCPTCSKEIASTSHKCVGCGSLINKPKRSIFGKLIKWSFILFNIFMAWWMFAGMDAATTTMDSLEGAEAAGAAIGTGIGAMLISGIWVIGDIILGLFVLFTRPKS
ncbi:MULTISPECIES: hypothetical protein [Agarivorans]|uniref:hypothetical protein n=1 Tax=Agarivorans TaxID=261825 RepID=UPI0010CF452B|nr:MULTISPECIES: hypothetical protein [Agarivorans]UPW18685.1 hypothetical protein M0C34_21125 [Agarivorans sp. TSD2052]GDY26403.1 hypothetical protein AHAT_22930 [Agarivorans sp. Toyoura001]